MRQLVALAASGGATFPGRLTGAWDDGDAVLPVDPRLPPPAVDRLFAGLAPSAYVDAEGERHLLAGGRPVEDGDALVVATSGSTGEPKGVVLTHRAVAASAVATSTRLGVDRAVDRWLACLPLAHVGGLGVVTRALALGTGLVVQDGFDAAAVEEEARRGGPVFVSLVPAALLRIDPGLFRTVVLGGSAVPEELRRSNVVTTYGMTETGSGVVYDGLPLDGVEVRLVDDEIQLRGPMLLRCYRGHGDGDDHDPKTAEGWLPTDDAGAWESDGRLTVFGRRTEMIVSGGEKVWPGVVEDVLVSHPDVADVAVAGRPDPEWGETVAAWVVPVDASSPPDLASLRRFVAEQLPSYAAPRRLTLVEVLPRTALGKLTRHRLPG